MCILEDHQHGRLARQRLGLCNERLHRSLPTLLRGKVEHGIASVVPKRQHLGKQRGVLGKGRGLCEQGIELVELHLRRVVMHQPSSTFHLADERIERAVGVLRGAEVA